jgi:hypothetical protein
LGGADEKCGTRGGAGRGVNLSDKINVGGVESILDGLDLGSYRGWDAFAERLEKLVAAGCLRNIPPLKGTPRAGEEWYVEDKTGAIFIYRIPDDRPTNIWTKVDPFAPEPEPERPSRNVRELDLRDLPVGKMSRQDALSLLVRLHVMIGFGAVEAVTPAVPWVAGEPTETWYKDLRTGIVYRLLERNGEDDSLWEPVRPSELQRQTQ